MNHAQARPHEDHHHHGGGAHHGRGHMGGQMGGTASLARVALSATLHCLTGCGIGEILGMVLGTALDLGNGATIAAAVVLAFIFGYALTVVPLIRAGLPLIKVAGLAFAADTVSIVIMEIVDNALMWLIPGAMDATLGDPLFWGALALSLALAALAAFPANYWLIGRGKGHAVVHAYHGQP